MIFNSKPKEAEKRERETKWNQNIINKWSEIKCKKDTYRKVMYLAWYQIQTCVVSSPKSKASVLPMKQ